MNFASGSYPNRFTCRRLSNAASVASKNEDDDEERAPWVPPSLAVAAEYRRSQLYGGTVTLTVFLTVNALASCCNDVDCLCVQEEHHLSKTQPPPTLYTLEWV